VFLYADLAHSTQLALNFDNRVAAKIVRAYLSSVTRLINGPGGKVRSFDGDRVMGVFIGTTKNTAAVDCALKINYMVTKLLRPKAEAKFPSLKQKGFVIDHCTGIASGTVLVVRGGVRGSNDLVFVGAAPNLAAKLSEMRQGSWNTYITDAVYKKLLERAKMGGTSKENMWSPVTCAMAGRSWPCYRSKWRRSP